MVTMFGFLLACLRPPSLKQNRGGGTLGFFTEASTVNLVWGNDLYQTNRTRGRTFLIPWSSLHNITTASQ